MYVIAATMVQNLPHNYYCLKLVLKTLGTVIVIYIYIKKHTHPYFCTSVCLLQCLLTIARIGGAEGYCNLFVCLSVVKIPANLRTLAL